MSLTVLVKSASNLPDVEIFTKSDPFTVVTLRGQKRKTRVIPNNLDPVWDETLTWKLSGGISGSELLVVEVYNHEMFGNNRILGSVKVPLREVVHNGRQSTSQTLAGKHGEKLTAKIVLELTYQAPPGLSAGVEATKSGDRGTTPSNQQSKEKGGQQQELPDKPTDFQVRVHVLEARKLVGSNPNPTVKVACGRHIQQTSTQKGTNSPVFDEVMSFSFREHPKEMFDRIVEVKVFNAKKIISDALIGSFKFELGLVYREEDHCFIHKWLLLTDPRHPDGGVKGYLKVSIQVLGPGDEPKHSPSLTEVHHDNIDIESNLLRPSGIRLTPVTLTVRIFQGEDIPQMDPSYFEAVKKFLHFGTVQKELVDPYCTVSFAGHTESTQVVWNEQNPKWNRQINLGVRFPSMCEKIRLQLKDKDNLNADDIIGTCYLDISEISTQEDKGFLPTFGPCFINCYGSPREYTDLPDKYDHLNKGLLEGVAYRGRVLVEVGMSLGQSPKMKTDDISTFDLDIVTSFLRRRKYKLFGAFFSASMVYPGNHPVQFEVSIGDYGNKQDDKSPIQSSTTPPSNPVYDGTKYYYLPWQKEKPVIEVDSQWEDCSYRINSLNLILFATENLKNGLNSVKEAMKDEGYDNDAIKEQLNTVLESLSEDLHQPLPELPQQGLGDGGVTKLDVLTRQYRMKEWRDLYASCNDLRRNLVIKPLLECVVEVEGYIGRLERMAHEPQNSVPDVIIWMLSNNKRVAVKRIPSHELMYSAVGKCRGKNCGKIQTIHLMPPATEKEKELNYVKQRAQVRLVLWLGLEKDQQNWKECCGDGELTLYAETYENEVQLFGVWGTTRLLKPHWSDASGEIKQPREAFDPPPPGWRWGGNWEIQPVEGTDVEIDEGLLEYTEEVFEHQNRDHVSNWSDTATHFWTDAHGTTLVKYEGKREKKVILEELEAPEGWAFRGDWEVDMNRAVDEEGWEYTTEAGLNSSYVPFERNVHLNRRRRWTRVRVRDHDTKAIEKKKEKHDVAIKGGWEYAPLGSDSFHLTKGLFDFTRRRRYVRRLVNEVPGARAVFRFTEKKGKSGEDEERKEQVPLAHLEFREYHTYQLRAYLYQARGIHSNDRTSRSDPYVVVFFETFSGSSRVVEDSISPMWDQTIISGQVKIFGDAQSVLESPPSVVMEFYDKDRLGKDDFLGSSVVFPTVRLSLDIPAPKLYWAKIVRCNKSAGEILAAFELLLDDGDTALPPLPTKASLPHTHYLVPDNIRPVLQKTRIEVLCWGVRDMKHYLLLPVDSPLVEVECGGVVQHSQHIEDTRKNPNFPDPLIHFEVYLPSERLYSPPLTIRVLDKRAFGFLPVVGTHTVSSVKDFLVAPVMSAQQSAAFDAAMKAVSHKEIETKTKQTLAVSDPDSEEKSEFDWWSKYYYSIGDTRKTQKGYVDQGYDGMAVYNGELEEAFNGFTDLVQTLPLYRSKGDIKESSAGQPVGYFKGSFKAYPIPEDEGASMPALIFSNIPSSASEPVEVIVRVYVIKGIDLQPRDLDGKSDPYIKIKVGNTEVVDDKDNYIPSDLDPIFGKMFEFPATLPLDHTLTVSVMDWDWLSADDLIGETKIDLENRFLSQHRATCGLPESFSTHGPNKWRDRLLPVEILDDLTKAKGLPPPEWAADGKSVTIGDQEYTLSHFESGKQLHPDLSPESDQRLALHILRQQNLVPEHIETRNLYTPMHPGISQGQLHMWVDMFKKSGGIPPPVDVSPRKPEKYVLRVVVWNTRDVQSDEISRITGEAMSDIFVKGWLRGIDGTQKTDVHYRTLNGNGHFNWRFVFPLEYLPAENVMVIKRKEHFYSLTETEHNILPVFTVQVWDNDIFTPDDFIGTVDFNLSAMPPPAKKADNCSLTQLSLDGANADNLFHRRRMKGWWPVYDVNQEGTQVLKGKLELEFEVLTEEEAKLRPAGRGREKPNLHPKLDPPNRPVSSLLGLLSPLKAFNFLVWRRYKKRIITILVVLFIILVIAMIF